MSDRRLYLVRHGRADRAAWDGPDHLRPLTAAGIARLRAGAALLADLDLGVARILTSPLVRARQTAEILAELLAPARGLDEDARLGPGFDVADLAAMLREHPGERLLLTGHEPDFSTVAGAVIGGGAVVCRKGSLLRLDLHAEDPPQGDLIWSLPPKVLARG